MKNVFGINVKEDAIDGKPLIIREVNEDISKRQDDLSKTATGQEQKAKLPRWLTIVQCLLYFIGITFTIGFLKSLSNVSIQTAWENGGVFKVIGAISLIVAIVLTIVERTKTKAVLQSDAYQELEKDFEGVSAQALKNLGVPEDAVEVDVFLHVYTIRKNGKKVTARALQMYEYSAFNVRLFKEEQNVCIADLGTVFAIPIDSLTRIQKINKDALFSGWNKKEAYNKGKYKEYNIRANNFGTLFVKPYYSLQFNYDGTDYEVLFPNYELENFCDVTGLQVEAPKKEKAEE